MQAKVFRTTEEILKNGAAEELPEDVLWVSECEEAEAHVVIIVMTSTSAWPSVQEALFAVVIVCSSLLVWKNWCGWRWTTRSKLFKVRYVEIKFDVLQQL